MRGPVGWEGRMGRVWPRYPSYRDSGVEWLGEVPEGWAVRCLKTVATARPSNVDKKTEEGQRAVRLCNYMDVYKNEFITADIEFMRATASGVQVREFGVRPGDVIATKDSETADDIAVPALVLADESDLVCGYHLTLIRPDDRIALGPYLFRAMQSVGVADQFHLRANGVTRFGLPVGAFTEAVFPLPPLSEQRAITAFLDRETAKIDTLVAKKERLLELLDEKRTALISRAVTKGLDPDVPMKNTGVEWLGEVPIHWEVPPVYSRWDVTLGKMLDAKRITGSALAPYLRNVDVQWDFVNTEGLPAMDFSIEDRVRYALRPGDLLVCEGGDVGRTAMWRGELDECYFQKAVHRVRPTGRDIPRYLFYVMLAASKRGVFLAGSNPNTIPHLTAVQLRHHRFPLPPLPEQRAIAAYLDRETARIDALKAKIQKAIDLLKEYRTALISAAVTGKIDVRGEVAEPAA